jgi:predicted DNA-binding transcriptional regulator YafY
MFCKLSAASSEVTVPNLMDTFGVSRRTVFRDMNRLREVGVPVYLDPESGCYRLKRDVGEFDVLDSKGWDLQWRECVALLAILERADLPEGSSLQSMRSNLLGKLVEWVHAEYGDRAGSVLANARLLQYRPSLSIEDIEAFMVPGDEKPSGAARQVGLSFFPLLIRPPSAR